jgi:hypothetical protein
MATDIEKGPEHPFSIPYYDHRDSHHLGCEKYARLRDFAGEADGLGFLPEILFELSRPPILVEETLRRLDPGFGRLVCGVGPYVIDESPGQIS